MNNETKAQADAQPVAPNLLVEFAKEFLADYQSEDGMFSMKHYAKKAQEALAAAPPARQPLTPEQIKEACQDIYILDCSSDESYDEAIARAIEQKHNIVEKP